VVPVAVVPVAVVPVAVVPVAVVPVAVVPGAAGVPAVVGVVPAGVVEGVRASWQPVTSIIPVLKSSVAARRI